MTDTTKTGTKRVPTVEAYIATLIDRCSRSEPFGAILTDVRRLTPFLTDVDPALRNTLAAALEGAASQSMAGVADIVEALVARHSAVPPNGAGLPTHPPCGANGLDTVTTAQGEIGGLAAAESVARRR